MIYLVTRNKELFNQVNYKIIGVDESLTLLSTLKIVGVDTETSGLDCHQDKLLSLQLGCYDFQVVIDCLTINIALYKNFLESDRLFLFWNARFDLKWLYRYNIIPHKVYDGFLAEKLMWLGYPIILTPEVWSTIKCSRYDYVSSNSKKNTKSYYIIYMNLKKAGEMYCGVELDKSIRGQIIYKGLVGEVIDYAATDVKYLERIMEKQLVSLNEKGLVAAMQYECRFILALAYMEFCGIKIDIDKWKNKMLKDQNLLKQILEQMNSWFIKHEPDSKYIKIERQGDLFNGFNTDPIVTINWNSSKQVIPLFKKYGVDTSKMDKETKEDKDSIEAKILKSQSDKCSLIPLYLKYKEQMKLCSTYGENFLKQINKKTGRLYTNFNPIGTDTARISSGGKDKANKIEYINMLNLPADPETRACFIAEKGNKWISIDYSGQETYILADIANDEAIIKELTYGSGDIHSLTAYMSYKEIPRDTPIKDIKKLYRGLRNEAKGIEFAINYGGDANTISNNKGIPIKDAQQIYNDYMSGFKGIKKYQDFCRKDVMQKGFIELNPKVGYKAYIYDFPYLQEIKSKFQEEGFWDYYREMKKEAPNCETVQMVKHFFRRKSDSEKQSINYRIQHTGALCYKVSMINFFEYLRRNDLLFKVLITVTPYDK
nr:MAG TPA: Prex DNA polymerase [Caudoviricetes sp.]